MPGCHFCDSLALVSGAIGTKDERGNARDGFSNTRSAVCSAKLKHSLVSQALGMPPPVLRIRSNLVEALVKMKTGVEFRESHG